MVPVGLDEAKAQLPEQIAAALRGETVVIAIETGGTVVLVPEQPNGRVPQKRRPLFGSARGKIHLTEDFDNTSTGQDGGGTLIAEHNKSVAKKDTTEARRKLFGSARGEIWMADDFDAPLPEFEEYI